MKAVIMAGGEGTRLRPLTCNLPKPMVPILNKPMMEHIINLLKRHQFKTIANTLWYLPDQITGYFQDGSSFGVEMEYFVEKRPLGTAGSVRNARPFLDDTFLVVSGDALTDLDLSAAVDYHKKKQAVATLVLARVANPLDYGVVLTDAQGRITQFLEKPSWSEVFSDTVNTGIYILEPEVLDLVAEGQKVDFSRDVFPRLLKRGAPLFGYAAQGYWSDIGNLNVYRKAHRDCLEGKVFLDLPVPQKHGVYWEEGVWVHPDAQIEGPVYLGKSSRIGAHAFIGPYCVLGSYNQIASHASLKRSILWSGVQVGSRAQLRGCLCAKNVHIQSEVEIYEGAVLGEKVQAGCLSMISSNIKIWPGKIIPSGSKLRQSLVWGNQERASLFSKAGISGDFRSDLAPEIITQVGLSYASFLGRDKRVLVTNASDNLAELAKEALGVGLRAGGLKVYDGGAVSGGLTRYAVQFLRLDGALHCTAGKSGENQVCIECWDGRGRPLGKSQQRAIENIHLREDFPRSARADLGLLVPAPEFKESYLQNLAGHYPAGSPKFKVGLSAASFSGNSFSGLVRDFLDLAGYEIVTEQLEGLPTIVIQERGWFFRDEQGVRLSDDGWWRMFVQALENRRLSKVAIPVNLSESVVQAAKQHGLKVQWTKMEPAFWMEIAAEIGVAPSSEIEIFPHIEPLASIGELLHFISMKNVPVSSWQKATHQESARIYCPWEEKGRIMRELIQTADPEHTIFLDGIREQKKMGWALVVPDGDEPVFRVYSEADTEEGAVRLIQQYVDLIKSYENKER